VERFVQIAKRLSPINAMVLFTTSKNGSDCFVAEQMVTVLRQMLMAFSDFVLCVGLENHG